ncbi:bifunctional 3-demethylubiquinone-9 3-methyltransferase/ 2-octaprenyl-6-hydroxy phenol methylase [Gimesia chilikensis]|uniref:Bifunctional 3-demethylubiquinone-9 3-methyltransferase/ 2-octaprenyl-6-hydroxy phenol methylase n=1 Tax=Gimesia chilikensis TaxID=2605989 RepID=A0A517WGQ0_9PLAN|nr:methyltransferase domain-containing protein [Gimesia chilikensis]QDU04438.1 bifunctional 3-demethylubiquinone-9 3-methyltransferase/ 2-octaprenyl-6-hydroxy phenol methylase [Gimesia chilikensis]
MIKATLGRIFRSLGVEVRRVEVWPKESSNRQINRISGRDEVAAYFCNCYSFNSILDVGCGKGALFPRLLETGAEVVGLDFLPECEIQTVFQDKKANYIRTMFDSFCNDQLFEAVIASHLIEHIPDTERFLIKFFSLLIPNGAYCLIWPPPKSAIVGGHVHLFNPGLMLYNLVRLGVDCRDVRVVQCGYSYGVMGRYSTFDVPDLNHDQGDIELLQNYFPFKVEQGFNGDKIPNIVHL